jgi:uncharacterized protein YbjT (DUF2867 family)
MHLITGARGNIGREVIRLLVAAGAAPVGVTRDASATPPPGARYVVGDPSRPGWATADLGGVETIVISPRAVGGATAGLLALAAAQGAKRVVLISALTVEYPAGLPRFAGEFKAAERAVAESGLPATVLRCGDFDANALGWAPQIRATGLIRGAYPAATTSPVDERDIAAVVVQALLDPAYAGRTLVLTGPDPLTQPQKARLIGAAIGREVTFVEASADQIRAALLAAGVPADVPDRLLGSLADYARRPGPTTSTVEQVLGRPAGTFAAWAADHAAAFRP